MFPLRLPRRRQDLLVGLQKIGRIVVQRDGDISTALLGMTTIAHEVEWMDLSRREQKRRGDGGARRGGMIGGGG